MTIFIKLDRLSSVSGYEGDSLLISCLRNFVPLMAIDKHMVASLCRLGNNAISMSLVSNSFKCMDISSFGCGADDTFPLCARDNGCLFKFSSFQWFSW